MIELTNNLHLLSEDEFRRRGRGDYAVVAIGKYDLRQNQIVAQLAPTPYGQKPTDPGIKPMFDDFSPTKGFRFYGTNIKPDTMLFETMVQSLELGLAGQAIPQIFDNHAKVWFDGAVYHSDVDKDGNIYARYEVKGTKNLVFESTFDPQILMAVVLDDLSIERINEKTRTITLMNDGAVAVSHVLVGVGVTFPSYLSRHTKRMKDLDTPFYKAYEMATGKIPGALLDEYQIELSPQQADMYALEHNLIDCEFEDDRLHQDQLDAVRVHLSTNSGFVNALQVGDGKTIATLMGLQARSDRQEGPYRSLVVLEASVRKQWLKEAEKWLDDGWSLVKIGSRSDTQKLVEALEHNEEHLGKLLVLCSYNMAADAEEELTQLGQILANTTFNDTIIDEGRTVRGSNKTARALWKIRQNTEVGIILCATPVLKSVNDLGALMAWARNDTKINGSHLREMFNFGDDAPLEVLDEWYKWWGPTLVRSTTSREQRTDSMARPRINPSVRFVNPSHYEVQVSAMILGKIKDSLQNIIDTYEAMGESLTQEQEAQLRGAILSTNSVARMAASDVRILANSDSGIAHLLRAEGLFDFPEDFIPSKMAACLAEVEAVPEPVVIFTEFQDTAKAMKREFDKIGIPSSLFIGSGGTRRDDALDAWRDGDTRVLIATSAAERGLNLQHAKHVFHYDHKFTPDSLFQRTGRVTRIGSVYTEVEAKFFVTRNTVDEKVFSVSVARAGLAGATAAKSAKDFSESDAAHMLKVLVENANPVVLPTKGTGLALALTRALCA